MMERAIGGDEAVRAAFTDLSPAKRVGQPEEVATVVSFLASSESSWISGHAVEVNGAAIV
jgi:NAD(P)-dependent dehydrogenase (short-subunit alcohol dehydrogenase family)